MIEAIVTCVDYADYLAETLPLLVRAVDSVLVVTSPHDKNTATIANNLGVRLHATEVFYRDGAIFNKGAAIQEGLALLSQQDWVLHTDADIAIMNRINTEGLDPECLYFAPRASVMGRAAWEYIRLGVVSSCCILDKGGMGYFQLWNATTCPHDYPDNCPTAAKTDLLFNKLWPKKKRRTLPQITYHLQMPGDVNKQNWQGRTSEPFA